MATKVKGVGVGVNIVEKSVTYVSNTVIQLLFRIAHKRGLDPSYIQGNLDVIEKGLRTWLSEQKLRALLLQVFVADKDDALENWETMFEYYADPKEEVRKPPVQEIEKACEGLAKLPPGATYRIFASLDPDATEVDGWVPGTPKSLVAALEKVFEDWGFGQVGAKVRYQGGNWGDA